ncbi:cytochrome P450 [Phlebopus sp. FC_14]|nr:cytochrome P450 [Phlebopus sp. FC_14]
MNDASGLPGECSKIHNNHILIQLLEDYDNLDKVLAAFYEGIRLFSSGVFLIREAKQDTVLDVSDDDEPKMLPVKKGTHIVVDMVGVPTLIYVLTAKEYNPRYFSEPEEFRPSRWYKSPDDTSSAKVDLSESEEYTAFSVGPRSCIGRKFATTEAVCLLALLLRDWRIEPLLAVNPKSGKIETVDEWRARVMQATMRLTMGVRDVPLRFVRRA